MDYAFYSTVLKVSLAVAARPTDRSLARPFVQFPKKPISALVHVRARANLLSEINLGLDLRDIRRVNPRRRPTRSAGDVIRGLVFTQEET